MADQTKAARIETFLNFRCNHSKKSIPNPAWIDKIPILTLIILIHAHRILTNSTPNSKRASECDAIKMFWRRLTLSFTVAVCRWVIENDYHPSIQHKYKWETNQQIVRTGKWNAPPTIARYSFNSSIGFCSDNDQVIEHDTHKSTFHWSRGCWSMSYFPSQLDLLTRILTVGLGFSFRRQSKQSHRMIFEKPLNHDIFNLTRWSSSRLLIYRRILRMSTWGSFGRWMAMQGNDL